MIKIVHIITGLGSGGAENMLYKLLKYSDKSKYYHEVISLMDEGVMGEKIINEGIKVHSLNISSSNVIASILKARRICKDFNVINTWLYHSDIFGFIISKILLRKKLIWNIRHSNLDRDANKRRTLWIVKVNAILSRYVNFITYNSTKAKQTHANIGYANKSFSIIPNGFELNRFKFRPQARNEIRSQLNIEEFEKIIVTVGRWDIQKDYYTLFNALFDVAKEQTNFKLLMIGTNLDYSNEELVELINTNNLHEKVILLGRRNDIPELLSAADFYISSSIGESFSNSIGEAMATELPCIVTDVGDSKVIVGDCGIIVESKNSSELASAIIHLIENNAFSREKIGEKCRNTIIERYSINNVVEQYEVLYTTIMYQN